MSKEIKDYLRRPSEDIVHPEKYRDIYSCRIIFRGPESLETFECPIIFTVSSFRKEIESKDSEIIKFMLLEALKNCWKELKESCESQKNSQCEE